MIAKAGKVDFLGACDLTHGTLYRKDNVHQGVLLRWSEIAHFTHVPVEDDAAESGVVRVIDEHDPTECIAPEGQAAVVGA